MNIFRFVIVVLLISATTPAYAEDCQEANRLVIKAFDLGDAPQEYPEQRRLLQQALDLCPTHAEAHNNLAWIFQQTGETETAIQHYRRAAQLKPELSQAWLQLGHLYENSGRFPLALEAYLHACLDDKDARARIGELLEENRYQTAGDGAILDKESLLLLFDPSRRAGLQSLLEGCRTRSGDNFGMRGVSVEPTAEFPNLLFDTGKAVLKTESLRQIEVIAASLQELPYAQVVISGHTDKQPFAGVTSTEENLRLNMRLSENRAASVARELSRRGIEPARILTQGFGPTQPAIGEDTPRAYARNRRVVVEVR